MRTAVLDAGAMLEEIALRIGLLLTAVGTRDVVDGHVALLARKLHALVVTSHPDDLRRLARTSTWSPCDRFGASAT